MGWRGVLWIVAVAAGSWSSATAQGSVATSERPVRRVTSLQRGSYDLSTGRVRRETVPEKTFVETFCYVNSDTSGFFPTPLELGGETIVDWGVMGGTGSTICSSISSIVTRFNFAYATSSADTSVAGPGAALTLSFYQDLLAPPLGYNGYLGFGADSGNLPVATFAFTGLPGFSGTSTGIGSAYAFTVDISGGSEILLSTGTFALGFASSEASNDGDGFANTGPLMCYTGNGAGGAEPATGNLDVYDSWLPDTSGISGGSFFFGGAPSNFTSWYLSVARADGTPSPGTVTFRNAGTNPSSYMASPIELGGTFSATVDNSVALVDDSPLQEVHAAPDGGGSGLTSLLFSFDTPFTLTLAGGQILLTVDFGSGELFTGSGLPPAVPGVIDTFFIPDIPINTDLGGLILYSQAISFGDPPFKLTNAQDLQIGYGI